MEEQSQTTLGNPVPRQSEQRLEQPGCLDRSDDPASLQPS